MKKQKFLLKVRKDNTAKIYINGKWLKDVTRIDICGVPYAYKIEIEQYKRGKNGRLNIVNNDIERKTSIYHLGSIYEFQADMK